MALYKAMLGNFDPLQSTIHVLIFATALLLDVPREFHFWTKEEEEEDVDTILKAIRESESIF